MADLGPDLTITDSRSVPLDGDGERDEVDLGRRKRLGVLPVADLRLRRHERQLEVLGLFERAADDLLDNLPSGVRRYK